MLASASAYSSPSNAFHIHLQLLCFHLAALIPVGRCEVRHDCQFGWMLSSEHQLPFLHHFRLLLVRLSPAALIPVRRCNHGNT